MASAKRDSPSTIPVPSSTRRRLWYMVIGAAVFIIIAFIEGLLRPDYDAWQQSVSALSLGPRGVVQQVSFFLFGGIVLSTTGAWRTLLAGRPRPMLVPVLTVLSGVSLIACGIFAQDPAPGYDPQQLALTAPTLPGLIHLLFAAIGALSSVISLLVMASYFSKDSLWRGWSRYTILMALIMVTSITVYAVWSTHAAGYAGSFERLGLLTVPAWCFTFLLRLGRGVPFMVHRT